MARIAKTSTPAAATSTPAKVAKVAKGNAPAAKPAKAEKAPKADKAPAAPRRSQWHGMAIVNKATSDAPARNGALLRYNAIVAHKRTDDAIGSEYTDTDGSTRKVTPADIAYLVKRGIIEVA